jgi:hypothetical protein
MSLAEDPPEEQWVDEQAGPVVRPYAMTRGRTRPTRANFDLITLVLAARPVPSVEIGLGPEHLAIITLCQHPLSVAELAAHLELPVGTVRVLLDDLLDGGFVAVREPQPDTAIPDDSVLEAMINGLQDF